MMCFCCCSNYSDNGCVSYVTLCWEVVGSRYTNAVYMLYCVFVVATSTPITDVWVVSPCVVKLLDQDIQSPVYVMMCFCGCSKYSNNRCACSSINPGLPGSVVHCNHGHPGSHYSLHCSGCVCEGIWCHPALHQGTFATTATPTENCTTQGLLHSIWCKHHHYCEYQTFRTNPKYVIQLAVDTCILATPGTSVIVDACATVASLVAQYWLTWWQY